MAKGTGTTRNVNSSNAASTRLTPQQRWSRNRANAEAAIRERLSQEIPGVVLSKTSDGVILGRTSNGEYMIGMHDAEAQTYITSFEVREVTGRLPVYNQGGRGMIQVGFTRGSTKRIKDSDIYDTLDEAIASLKRFRNRKAVKRIIG